MLGFAWPHMTFVSVDDLKLVIMANVWPPWYPKSLTYLKTPLLKVTFICHYYSTQTV